MKVSTSNETKKKNFKGGKKPMKKKIEMQRFTKEFSDISDGIADLCDRSEYIFDLLKECSPVNALPADLKGFTETIVGIMNKYMPDKEQHKNLLWEYTLSANKISVKTDKYIGFGLQVFYNNIQGNIIKKYVLCIDVYGDRQQELIDDLTMNEWNKFVYTPKKKVEKKEEE